MHQHHLPRVKACMHHHPGSLRRRVTYCIRYFQTALRTVTGYSEPQQRGDTENSFNYLYLASVPVSTQVVETGQPQSTKYACRFENERKLLSVLENFCASAVKSYYRIRCDADLRETKAVSLAIHRPGRVRPRWRPASLNRPECNTVRAPGTVLRSWLSTGRRPGW